MKMLVRLYLLIACVLLGGVVFAGEDTLVVRKDARFEMLAARHAEVNKRFLAQVANGLFKGYRVQLLSTSSRDAAFGLQATLSNSFPEQKSYVTYQSPNFRVRIGNFLRREDAEAFRKQLLRYYPEGLYIVEDAVEISLTDNDEIIVQ